MNFVMCIVLAVLSMFAYLTGSKELGMTFFICSAIFNLGGEVSYLSRVIKTHMVLGNIKKEDLENEEEDW